MGRKVAGVIAVIGWASLILQFVLHMTNVVPEPTTLERFVRFFSYFTITTNIIVAATLTAIAFFPSTRFGRYASKPSTQAAVASYITIVGVVYSLFLRSVWDPAGWQAVADHALHDIMPLLAIIYWFVFAPKAGIVLADVAKWLMYPIVYVVYSLVRGAFVDWYPYWFVDVTQFGYPKSLAHTGLVLIAFAVVGFVYFGLSKLLAGRNESN
ncbi:MAG: Pr6Pr family membrane protein [Pyrinomonadaceae bacterium]